MNYFTYATPHGPLTIQASARGITAVAFGQATLEGTQSASTLTNQAASQLQEYLAGKRYDFDLPLDMQGSAFQKTVWGEVCNVPYGQVVTARDIADRIGKSGAYRSVGTAIKQCALAPLVPTHRVQNPGAKGPQAKIFHAFVALEQRKTK